MNLCSTVRALAFGALLALCPIATATDRSLVQIKTAAEAGNPQAQYEFARSFPTGGPELRKWILAAATQGMGAAQDALAWEGIWGKFLIEESLPRTRALLLQTHAARMQESLIWAAYGADKGFDHSRLILGFAYFRGTFVRRNEIEAYRWLSLVREVAPVEAVYLNRFDTRGNGGPTGT